MDREPLRQELENRTYGTVARVRGTVDRPPEVHIVIGLPRAGKSTFSEPLAAEIGALAPDADRIKAMIPEFVGGATVHNESVLTRVFGLLGGP